MGDTRYVRHVDGGNGGSVSQVMVLGYWDRELRPEEWWVVSQASEGGAREEGEEGGEEEERPGGGGAPCGCRDTSSSLPKRRRRPTSGSHFRRSMGNAAIFREARVTTRWNGVQRGVTRGARRGVRRGVTKRVTRKGTRGVRRVVPGATMRRGNPPPRRRGSMCAATRERGGTGARG